MRNISFLIIGLGSIGKRHLRNLTDLGVKRIYALTSGRNLSPDEKLPPFETVTDLTTALRLKPNAVIIANPTSLHMKVAVEAAKAGCHIFFEKPISHSMENVNQLNHLIHQKNLIVQVGFQFRFHPVLKKIKEWIDENSIGKIISAHAHWGEYLPLWHPWEDYRHGYSARSDLGGGVVLTLCHPFDYLRWFCGEVDSVSATMGKISHLEIDTEDTAAILMRFNSGALGTVYLDYVEQPPQHNVLIIGEKGKIMWNNSDSTAQLFINQQQHPIVQKPAPDFDRNTMFYDELNHFVGSIKYRRQPECNFEDGIRTLEIVLAAKESALQKKEIKINHIQMN